MQRWLLVLLASVVFATAQAQFEKLETRVREALAKDKPYRALTLSERALTRKDAPPVFHLLRAEGFNRIGKYTQAMEQLRMAPALSTAPEYRTNLIGAYTGLGRLDSAEAYIAPVVDPGATEEYLYRAGRVLALRERWTEALAHFNVGVERHGGSARMFRERGACYAMLGDSSQARADLDKAVAMAPRDAAAYNSRGYFRYMIFGDYKQAIADMDRAIKQDPNYGFAFSNRGWCSYQLGDTAKARKDLAIAVRKNPTNAYAFRSIGIIDIATGDLVKGCSNLRKALELGFTATYGVEVEELIARHCGTLPAPAPAPAVVPPLAPPPANAPDTPAPKRTNAP